MKKLFLIMLVFMLSCADANLLRENKKNHPIGSFVYLESRDLGIPMRIKAKVDGYNADGTLKVLSPYGCLTSDGKIMYGDTTYDPKEFLISK